MGTRLYAFHVGGEMADMAVFDPFDPAVGTSIEIPYFFYLIQHPEGNILFDTGAHPSLMDNPHDRLGPAADTFIIKMRPGDDIPSKLGGLGLGERDVPHVALSHLHYDHAGQIALVPDATFYVQSTELAFAHWPAVYQRALYVSADFDLPVAWKELRGEYDVFNDGTVVLFPTPGHTPGHQSMLVRLEERPQILVGDAAYLPSKMAERILPGIVWSPDAMVESWELIEEYQRRYNAEVICTHDLDWQGKTKLGPEAWYE